MGGGGETDDPFRVWCGLVGELRSLLSAPLLALTATASRTTREIILFQRHWKQMVLSKIQSGCVFSLYSCCAYHRDMHRVCE